jgi:hemerythrin superfamily protein
VTAQEDVQKARQRPNDLIAAILEDHAEIKQMFAAVQDATTTADRDEHFAALMRKLVIHETAEQEVSHPLARQAQGGDAVVDERLEEEKKGEKVLKRMEGMNPDDPDFASTFASLHSDVLAHAEHEESEEFPLLEAAADAKKLERMAMVFRAAEKATPTRPHPSGPTSPAGNLVVGPLLAIADRARDAIAAARTEHAS